MSGSGTATLPQQHQTEGGQSAPDEQYGEPPSAPAGEPAGTEPAPTPAPTAGEPTAGSEACGHRPVVAKVGRVHVARDQPEHVAEQRQRLGDAAGGLERTAVVAASSE